MSRPGGELFKCVKLTKTENVQATTEQFHKYLL
jgi:hypothetical protein